MFNSILYITLKEVVQKCASNKELENLQRVQLLGYSGYACGKK